MTKITASTSQDQLPDEVSTLKQMVLTLLAQIDDLHGQLYYLKRQLFGKKSEKLNPNQRLLFENLYEEVQTKIEQQKQPPAEKTKSPRNRNHKGRKPLPADLPREIIEIEPDESEKVCALCHHTKERIGEEVTEKLEFVPASFMSKAMSGRNMPARTARGISPSRNCRRWSSTRAFLVKDCWPIL